MTSPVNGNTWRNWAGIATATPTDIVTPSSVEEVVTLVERARADHTTVKVTGAGHSFTDIAAASHTLIRPEGMQGIVDVDREAMTVTAHAGTHLKDLNAALEGLGLSLHNMGDIAEQTLAGATSTGTHGTGGIVAGLSPQLAGFELVTGTGEVVHASATDNADIFEFGRVGLGALGVLTKVTFKVEPLFVMEAHEQPMRWDQMVSTYDTMTEEAHHVDMLWFPHTDKLMAKQNFRTDLAIEDRQPPSKFAAWWEDEFVSNSVFGVITRIGNRFPSLIPRINQISGSALSERKYSDIAHRVFVTPRRVVFREMEYAVPREVGLEVLSECRKAIDASDWKIGFPIEVRHAPADDIPMSTGYGRDSLYLAFHVPQAVDHTPYFTGVEKILKAAGGRPHWGKLHTRNAEELRTVYPRFDEFLAMRDRLDPDRVFANDYLRRVLGD